ncbi:MAG: exo-alpha-sialidase [Clostridia bacterium]|nr:exo-alpha-sialidase [Clostridia bacterium]
MKKIKVKNSIVCKNDDSVFNYYAWPTVTRLPDGTLAALASGFRLEHLCPFGKVILCRSRDEGESWSEPSVIIDTPLDDRDSGIAVFGNNNVIVTSFNNTVAFQRKYLGQKLHGARGRLAGSYLDSIDAQKCESKYLGSTYKISKDGGYTFGELKRAPVTSPHGPCELPDKSLLYVGSVYGDTDAVCQIRCYTLNEMGDFEYLSSIEDVGGKEGALLSCEPHALALPNGKIIVHIRMQNKAGPAGEGEKPVFTIYQSESYDRGKTFTTPHSIGLQSGAPAHLMRHSSGVLISSYGYREEPFGQRVMLSRDDGETWDTDYILREDGPSFDLGYPSTVELKNGALLTVYYQQEAGRNNCVIMQSIWNLPENQNDELMPQAQAWLSE